MKMWIHLETCFAFGLLMPCLGRAATVAVEFESLVNQGDDVVMTCSWDIPSTNDSTGINMYWTRRIELGPGGFSRIWTYRRNGQTTTSNSASSGFSEKFKSVDQQFVNRDHKMKLVGAEKEDEGTFYCRVFVTTGSNQAIYTSNTRLLAVRAPTAPRETLLTETYRESTVQPKQDGAEKECQGSSVVVWVLGFLLLAILVIIVILIVYLRRRSIAKGPPNGPLSSADVEIPELETRMSTDPQSSAPASPASASPASASTASASPDEEVKTFGTYENADVRTDRRLYENMNV